MPRSVLDCYLILKIMWHLALINLLYANATRFDIRQTAVAAAAAGTLSQSASSYLEYLVFVILIVTTGAVNNHHS